MGQTQIPTDASCLRECKQRWTGPRCGAVPTQTLRPWSLTTGVAVFYSLGTTAGTRGAPAKSGAQCEMLRRGPSGLVKSNNSNK